MTTEDYYSTSSWGDYEQQYDKVNTPTVGCSTFIPTPTTTMVMLISMGTMPLHLQFNESTHRQGSRYRDCVVHLHRRTALEFRILSIR